MKSIPHLISRSWLKINFRCFALNYSGNFRSLRKFPRALACSRFFSCLLGICDLDSSWPTDHFDQLGEALLLRIILIFFLHLKSFLIAMFVWLSDVIQTSAKLVLLSTKSKGLTKVLSQYGPIQTGHRRVNIYNSRSTTKCWPYKAEKHPKIRFRKKMNTKKLFIFLQIPSCWVKIWGPIKKISVNNGQVWLQLPPWVLHKSRPEKNL